MLDNDDNAVKKPNGKLDYGAGGTDDGKQNLIDLAKCVSSPLYFMRNFMRARHATKGSVPFEPYDYQVDLINAFKTHRYNIVLSGRQLGKCFPYNCIITKDKSQVQIGSLFQYSFKEYCVFKLEKALLFLTK
jgi:hypothetical protein